MPAVDTETPPTRSPTRSPASRDASARRYHDIGIDNEFGLAACVVPFDVAEELGIETQRGRLCFDAAAMGRLLLLDRAFGDRTDSIEYEQGFAVEQRKGEFITSLKSLARSLYARVFFCRSALDAPQYSDTNIGNESKTDAPSFEQFYHSFAMDMKRRVAFKDEGGTPCPNPMAEQYTRTENGEYVSANYVWNLGRAATKDDLREWETADTKSGRKSKNRDYFGKRLSVRGTPHFFGAIVPEPDPPQRMVQATYVPPGEDFAVGSGMDVRAASYFTVEAVTRYRLDRAFTQQRSWHGKGTPWRVVKGFDWQQRAQRRSQALKPKMYRSQFTKPSVLHRGREKHITVGAWRKAEADPKSAELKQKRACTMPFIVLDIDVDEGATQLAKEYADLICDRLSQLGADIEDVLVSYTGGTGFHVRIPAGMVGNPIFRTGKDAQKITRRFAKYVFGDLLEGDVWEAIDAAKFSPNALIRAVGSRHPESGLYCVAYSGAEFRDTILWKIKAHADVYSPFTLSDPLEAETAPELAAALSLASKEHEEECAAMRSAKGDTENRGIIAAAEEGVAKGEEFAPGYVGRNYAALLLSLNYVQRFGEEEAWERVQQWNREKNRPPLGTDPTDDKGELRYVFERAARKAEEQAAAES